jgi:hypothetical protein
MKKIFKLLLLLSLPIFCSAAASENYKIDADVIGIGGNKSQDNAYPINGMSKKYTAEFIKL